MSSNINKSSMLRIGSVLHGTYRIDGYLSSGGFGNTYIATNIQFEEVFAIKEFFMRGVTERDSNNTTVSVSNNENKDTFSSQLEKFKKEARRLRKLHSTHIVHVHDLFEENGTAYYVMDYVDGENLNEHLKKTGQPMTEEEILNILPQILDALNTAHSAGIWHLDLKPANIMVDKAGVAKLIDFGASKQQSSKGGATTTTAVSYTNGYAPREQMEQNLDKFGPWTDFYALGATLYTLLTNKKPPLPSDIDDDGTPDKHLALPMPSEISTKTKELILWLMSTSRMKRPQSVADIEEYLASNKIYVKLPSSNEEEYEGETIVGDKNTSSKDEDDDQDESKDSQKTRLKERANGIAKVMLYIIGGFAIGTVIFFGVMTGYSHFGNASTNNAKNSIAIADSLDSVKRANEPVQVQKFKCKVSQGSCEYTGILSKDSIPNGQGEAWFTDGRYYKGNFDNGKMVDQKAYFRYPNGDTYEGSFANDHFSQGKYTIAEDKSYFVGTYDSQGQPLKGTWYANNGEVIENV